MTTGRDDVISELSKTFLRCDVCHESFNLQTRLPRLLSCFHSLCGACVRNLCQKSSISCPTCRRVTAVPQGTLPADVTRMVELDRRQRAALQSRELGAACESCSTEGARATSRCQDCHELLCEDCCAAHRKMKVFREHVVVALPRAAPDSQASVTDSCWCQRHAAERLTLFCLSCAKMACPRCAVTEHSGCRQVAELSSVLEEKKAEMLSLCGQLDKVQQSFRRRAEESEASIEIVGVNLNKAVKQVEDVFAEIISSAREREKEILCELRAMAKSDGLLLEEQAATFRSLQAAAQSAADYGRRVVSLDIAVQVVSKNPEIQKIIAEFDEMTRTPLKPIPRYKVTTEKLEALKKLMKQFGDVGSYDVADGIENLPLTLTTFQLDASRCGAGCWVGEGQRSLSNQPMALSRPPRAKSNAFRFAGTCGTAALAGSAPYWQVHCQATPRSRIKGGYWLCAVGVATQQALLDCPGGDRWISSSSSHSALAVRLYTGSGHARAQAMYGDRSLVDARLGAASMAQGSLDLTLGLLLDAATACLHVIDVTGRRLLCSSGVDLAAPLWPVVRVWPEDYNGAVVHLEVQTNSEELVVSGDVVALLQSLLDTKPRPPQP